jgi:hypothetical protein
VHGPAGDALARHDGGPMDLVLFATWAASGLLLLVVCLAVVGLLLPVLERRA